MALSEFLSDIPDRSKLTFQVYSSLTIDDWAAKDLHILSTDDNTVTIFSHGYPDGRLDLSDLITGFIRSHPEIHVQIVCCFGETVAHYHPDLAAHILTIEFDGVWTVIASADIDTRLVTDITAIPNPADTAAYWLGHIE